jgi:hypothetical protein
MRNDGKGENYMSGTNIKGAFGLNRRIKPLPEINSISDLPKITSFILPRELELLPNVSEVFELEFAFYEYKFLTKDEIIRRGAF